MPYLDEEENNQKNLFKEKLSARCYIDKTSLVF